MLPGLPSFYPDPLKNPASNPVFRETITSFYLKDSLTMHSLSMDNHIMFRAYTKYGKNEQQTEP
ncbi:hypothetical protein EBR66_05530 [bacterium]|nr:hypothetical protein [bacterium]